MKSLLGLSLVVTLVTAGDVIGQEVPSTTKWVVDSGLRIFGTNDVWIDPPLFQGFVWVSYRGSARDDTMYVDPSGSLFRREREELARYGYDPQVAGSLYRFPTVVHRDTPQYGLRPVFGCRDGRLLCQRIQTNEWGYIDPNSPSPQFVVEGVFRTTITACNGRDIYGAWFQDIVQGDLTRPGWSRILTRQTSIHTSRIVRRTRDGRVIWLETAGLFAVDPKTGVTQRLASEPVASQATTYFLAYDPWSDQIAAADHNVLGQGCYAVYSDLQPAVQWRGGYGVPWFCENRGLIVATPEPYEVFGRGCTNSAGSEQRIEFYGVGRLGGSFTLQTEAADPGAAVAFWLGGSETSYAGASLPLALDPLGGVGCDLLCSIDVVKFAQADANGVATWSLSVPNQPMFQGLDVYAQFAATRTSSATAFGTSDAVMIRLRQR